MVRHELPQRPRVFPAAQSQTDGGGPDFQGFTITSLGLRPDALALSFAPSPIPGNLGATFARLDYTLTVNYTAAVPEPSTLGLMPISGLVTIVGLRWRNPAHPSVGIGNYERCRATAGAIQTGDSRIEANLFDTGSSAWNGKPKPTI